MASKWFSSPLTRILSLTTGVSLLTLGINENENGCILIGACLVILAAFLFYSSQKQLREKSWLMLEAIRNRDYSFRLPTHGFIGGERILQNTLNEFGAMMGEQKQLMEQRERFYEQVLSGISSGIIVLDQKTKSSKVIQLRHGCSVFRPLALSSNWSATEKTFRNCWAPCLPANVATCNMPPPKEKCNC